MLHHISRIWATNESDNANESDSAKQTATEGACKNRIEEATADGGDLHELNKEDESKARQQADQERDLEQCFGEVTQKTIDGLAETTPDLEVKAGNRGTKRVSIDASVNHEFS